VSATSSAAAMPSASASASASGVCFKCVKRHDDEQHRGEASAYRQNGLYCATGLGAPHRRGWLSLAISPRPNGVFLWVRRLSDLI
jgi:hypothetical protein